MITVNDVLRQALPAGTQVRAGGAGLEQEVTWATRLRPVPPAFGHLNGGEVVFLSTQALELVDERLTLESAVRQLAGFGVAAVGFLGEATIEACAAADELALPLLVLPEGTDLGSLERETARAITERRRAIRQRSEEVGRTLIDLAISGEPLPILVRTLAELSDRAAVLEDIDGEILAFHAPSSATPGAPRATLASVESALAESQPVLAAWLREMAASSPADPPTSVRGLDERWNRVVAPVIGRDGLLGSVSLLVPRGSEASEDGMITSRGAAACAVVLARDQAAANVRREVELNVLDEVLDGALRSEVSLRQQARRLGHDLDEPHVAVIVRMDQPAGGPAMARGRDARWALLDDALVRAGAGREARVLWRVRNNSGDVVWPAPSPAEARRVARQLHDDLVDLTRGGPDVVSIGFGRPHAGLDGIRRSHQEARQALTLGRRLHGPGHLTGFDDLGVYRLIYAAEGLPELRSFHSETLDSLITYDREHSADLIRTLDAFFRANASPKEAANLLGVHRNTVLYRLDRIVEITGLDLDSADVRLRLQFALHVHMALFSE
jgi:purine catabolism regulator